MHLGGHYLGIIILTIIQQTSIIVCQGDYGPALPPYFFLCSYHGNSEQPSLETKEVTVNIAIDGNPSYYVPGQKYKVRIRSSKNFDSIHVTGLYTMKSNHLTQLPRIAVGAKEPFGENFACSIVHSHISHEPHNNLEFLWLAPPNGTGCISFMASAKLGQIYLFKEVTVMQLCEEGDAESNPPRPTLASLHDDGVIFRDDFDTMPTFNTQLWDNCDGVSVSDICGVIIHGKAGVACKRDGNLERQLITVPLNLTNAALVQFSIGSGTCTASDGKEQIQLFYSIDDYCKKWVYFNEFTLSPDAGVATHLYKIPEEAKREGTCLRWLQPLHPNGNAYVGCWAIDNVLMSNLANTSDVIQEDFDPIDSDNWLFFPGAKIRHKCHSESNALVFDNNDQFYNFAVTKDVDLHVEDKTPLLMEDFEGSFSQSWVIDGGELNDTCGEIYGNMSVVMSGQSKARKLCTPYVDLRHTGALHFYYSQGNSACSTFNENWSKVFCFAENRLGHSVLLRMLNPEGNENPELKIIPIPPRARNLNSRICWIQKAHEGKDKDVWAVDHVALYPDRTLTSHNYVQFTVNMNCGLHAGNSSMVLEYSADYGQNWYVLHQQCLLGECPHQPTVISSAFNSHNTDSWVRVTQRVPMSAMTKHTRFRWKQTSAIGHSGWALDNIYIGQCLDGCNGHGYCLESGCRCDLGFTGPTCAKTTGPLTTILIEPMTSIPSITRNFPLVRGGSLSYRCGIVASGKAVVFHSSGPRILETMNLNTTEAKYLQFSIRVGSESDVGDCSPPNSKNEAVLLQASCNGGIDWLTLNVLYGAKYRQPSLVSIDIPAEIQKPVCKFRWYQPRHSGLNYDVWAIDDVSFTRTMYNTLELDFSDITVAEGLMDVHMGEIGEYCGQRNVLSFTEPYQEGEYRYTMTNSMLIGSSYVLQFDLKMGCHQPFLDKLDNDIYLEYSLNHGMNWNLVKEGCWPPNMCDQYHSPTKYPAAKFKDWKRVVVKLPEHTWSKATRFRWRQSKWATSDSWAIDNVYIGQQCTDNCNGHGHCVHGACKCDEGYHGKTCIPKTFLPSQMDSDFSMMSQLKSDWLSVIGGSIVGANEGCGTLLSGESLYFSKYGPRELVTKDLNTNSVDYVEFYLRMGYGSDLQCRGMTTRSENLLLQYSNDGGITWHLIKELQAFDYATASFVHIDLPPGSHTASTRLRWWQPIHDGEYTDQWAVDQVNIASYKHYKEFRDDFEFQYDQPSGEGHPVWQLITEGMYAIYCQSDTDTLMFADQRNDKIAMTKDLQLKEGDIVQFRINVGCSRSFSYHHPVLLQYTHDAGMTWNLLEKPCYVKDNCHDKYTEGSVYYSGTHGKWVLVVLPVSKEVFQKPVNLRWWQKGGPTSSFALDDVYIGPTCPDMCNGHGVCDYGTVCQCDPGYTSDNNCASIISSPLYMVDRFDNRNHFGDLWAQILGGDLGMGCGILDAGSSLYFTEEGTREARTIPLNTIQLMIVQFVVRIGSKDNHKGCRRPSSRDEAVIVDYSIDGGITWHVLRTLDPSMLNDGPKVFTMALPQKAKTGGTVLRWWQPIISPGTERAEWAIDSVVIAVNESATLGFEEHFDPMQQSVWYMSMNAVPRITCSSKDDALVFSKNGGKMRYAETWDYQVTPSTFLQFDIAMACTGTYSTLYQVMLQYSTDMGKEWNPVIEECLPPRTDCRGYHQSSQFQSDQHTNWTRTTLYLPQESVSPSTRFRWIQDTVTLRGNVWALDNIYLGEGCPWLCSGHGYCHLGTCVCDKGYGGDICSPTEPLPMFLREEFNLPLSKDLWKEIYGGEVTNLCGVLVSANAVTFYKNQVRLIVTTDLDTSMATFVQFMFKYGCYYVPPDWTKEHTILLQYSTNGGITWYLLKELHYKNYEHPRYFSLPLPTPAQSNATRFRFWQPNHDGHMNSVWSIDNFYVGGSPMLSDTLYETFDGEPNPESWLFWPGGQIAKFCSFNTRSDSILSGSSGMVFSRGPGEHSITTHDLMVNEVSVIQFDINVGCTSKSTKEAPVRLEYSTDFGLTWNLVVSPCSHNAVTCHDPIQDATIYYAGETPFWRRVIVPFNRLKLYGSVRFRWYQGHFTLKSTNPEWAIDNIYIGMQCWDNCNGHGNCVNGMFCQCDDGYGGSTCLPIKNKPTFFKEEFEGVNNPLESSQLLFTSGGVKSEKCGTLLGGKSIVVSDTGARYITTRDLNMSYASVIQFYIKRGCSDPNTLPDAESEPILLQYSTNGGITWTILEDFCFMKGTNQPEYVAVEVPDSARTSSTRIRWFQPSETGMYVENWALDQVYIGGDITGRLIIEDDLSSKYNDYWLMYPGAVIQSACGYRGNTLHFTDLSNKRFAVTGDIMVTDSTYLQFYISVGCSFSGKCYGVHLEYSKDFGKHWQPVIKECIPTDIDCSTYHKASVYTSDVYSDWTRVTVHLPQNTRSLATRFRWIQYPPFDRSQSWAVTQIYIGDECDCSCAGHGQCRRGTCVCDGDWIGDSCNQPEWPLPTRMRDSFNVAPGKDKHVVVYGGYITTQCGILAAGSAMHFKGACTRELRTKDMNLQTSTFIQFYFKFGCISQPTNRDENVLIDYSKNGGIQWTNMGELYYDQYSNASYVMIDLPKDAKYNGVRIRWWQPNHPGQSKSDWAIDNIFIGGKDINPNEVKDDFKDNNKDYAWIETDNGIIAEYCGSRYSITGEASTKEAVTLTTIDTTIRPTYIIQFSISVGCNTSRQKPSPTDKQVAPVHLQYSKDYGMHWDHLIQECLPFVPGCYGKAKTASIYYPTGGWRRVTIPLDGAPVSGSTRFRWQQKIDSPNLIPQDWAIDDLYIGPACLHMCSGHGQCDHPVCICDRGYHGQACHYGGPIKTYLKDTFDNHAITNQRNWFMVQGGLVGEGCSILSEDYSVNMKGTGQRQLVTVDMDLRNARFIQYVAMIGSRSSITGCGVPKTRNESVVLQYSTDGGISWTTIHILDYTMYWKSPHYDYIDLPLAARSHHTRFRWWQPLEQDGTWPPAVWSIDNVYIGGFEINPSYLEEHFEGVIDEQKFEFHPNSQLWSNVCNKSGKAMIWPGAQQKNKYIITQQLIIQDGYMIQFKIQVGCGSDMYLCNRDQPVVLQYNKDPHTDTWQAVFPRCMLNDHETNMDCPPYRFSPGSFYTADVESKWTRVTLELPPKLFSGNTRFRWIQLGTDKDGPSWSIDDIYIGEKCPGLCSGRGDCVQQKCVCDRGYIGETCQPQKHHLLYHMIEGFEGILSPSKWSRVDGRGEGNGCGALLPHSLGKNLYFDSCGVRQAITAELDLSNVSKIMFVLQIGSVQQSSTCNVNLTPAISQSTGWVFLQYTNNKGIDWHLLATHDPNDFLIPKRVGYALPREVHVPGVQFRWWQPEHGGKGYDQWALDYVEIIRGIRNNHLHKSRHVQAHWPSGK